MNGKSKVGVTIGIPIISLVVAGVGFGVLKGNVTALEKDVGEVRQAPIQIAEIKKDISYLREDFAEQKIAVEKLDDKMDKGFREILLEIRKQ